MHIFRKKLLEIFGGMEYSQYFCIRFREHRHGGCLRESKDRDLWKVYIDREVVQEQTSTLFIYSVEDLGRTTVQFLEKNIFGSVLKTDNKLIE